MTSRPGRPEGILLFAAQFWRPHVWAMVFSAILTVLSISLYSTISTVAREVAKFDIDKDVVGEADAMWIWAGELTSFPPGLVRRCAFLAVLIVTYHTLSFFAHVWAHRAGQGVHNTIVETVLSTILQTEHEDRIASVSPVKLVQVILSSARTSADVIGSLLSSLLYSVSAAVMLLVMLLSMSIKLTVTLGVVLLTSQLILLGGRYRRPNRSKELALAESDVQAFATNALHRSATVRVFHAESLINSRLREHLDFLSQINLDVVTAIHGQTGFSAAVTGVLFVVVLGITNGYKQRGELDIVDIAEYYIYFSQFINCILSLMHVCQQTLSLLEQLYTLQRLISWYDVGSAVKAKIISREKSTPKGEIHLDADSSNEGEMVISLEDVTYRYPDIPDFLLDATRKEVSNPASDEGSSLTSPNKQNGVCDLSLNIRPGTITALFGPSGCGKSTTLRLLSGLLKPQKGTVTTHTKVAILEQQQAVLLGSVAENILMVDVASLSAADALKAREAVSAAIRESACSDFVADPFKTLIHSADKTQFSGGQLQRVCMARLFAHKECSLLLLDEPTNGLDAASVAHLLSTLSELNTRYKKTIVLATHDARVKSIAHDVIDFRNHSFEAKAGDE